MVYLLLLLFDIIVLALAARVNAFQEFFFMADIFPLALSIVTLIVLFFMLLLDFTFTNSFTARPPFEIGMLYVLSVFWLAFSAFSTSRWQNIPMSCGSIPDEFTDERTWCSDVQALKSFMWIFFLAIFFTASFTLRYALLQHRAGNRQIWVTPLSRYSPHPRITINHTSSFFDGSDMGQVTTMTDYFGSTSHGVGYLGGGQGVVRNWEKFES